MTVSEGLPQYTIFYGRINYSVDIPTQYVVSTGDIETWLTGRRVYITTEDWCEVNVESQFQDSR